MAMTIGPVKIKKYSLEFKLKAVRLSDQPGVLIKDVARSLCIHPFMLSRWRKQVRDGELVGDPPPLEPQETAELQRLGADGGPAPLVAFRHHAPLRRCTYPASALSMRPNRAGVCDARWAVLP